MDITGKTKLTGLIGSPVAHSISPQMHNEAFRQLGLDYIYLAFDISDDDLKNYFSKYGVLESCFVMRYPNSTTSKGFGFVVFRKPVYSCSYRSICIGGRPNRSLQMSSFPLRSYCRCQICYS